MSLNKKSIYKILSFLLIFYFVNSFIYDNVLFMDSINEFQSDVIENNINNTNISHEENTLCKYDKFKRWLYWHMFVRDSSNYIPYNNFKNFWNKEYNFKNAFKIELKTLSKNPYTYIAQKYKYKLNRIKIEREIREDFYKKNFYIEGQGWISKRDKILYQKQGYIIQNSKLIKRN